jgi:putative membrane protein
MNDTSNARATTEADADPRVDLAVERTELALERTHLAWIRTMFTLMTAGIAIDKGLQIIHEQRMMKGEAWVQNAHFVGLALTVSGTFLLLIETIQFVKRSRQLSKIKKSVFNLFSPGLNFQS